MAIQFSTDDGQSVRYDLRARQWEGSPALLAAVHSYTKRPQSPTPVSKPIGVDLGNEIWAYLHGYWALINAGVLFHVDARPDMTAMSRVPPDAVA